MNLPKLILLDKDGVINFSSKNPESPLYYVLDKDTCVIKPGVIEALKLIKIHGIPVIVVTKQRCISKGLTDAQNIEISLSPVTSWVNDVWIEETAQDKTLLFERALKKYKPEEIILLDDSIDERYAAAKLGIASYDATNLLETIVKIFELK